MISGILLYKSIKIKKIDLYTKAIYLFINLGLLCKLIFLKSIGRVVYYLDNTIAI